MQMVHRLTKPLRNISTDASCLPSIHFLPLDVCFNVDGSWKCCSNRMCSSLGSGTMRREVTRWALFCFNPRVLDH